MGATKSFINRILGRETPALEEKQTDDESRIGHIKREFIQHPSKGLTPQKLYRIMEDAEQGNLRAQSELFEDMEEKDPQIGADLGKRRQLASELEWQIIPPEDATASEKSATDFCRDVFAGLDVEDLIIELGSGIGHGWVNLELPWELNSGQHIITQPIARPHSWFELNRDDYCEIRLRSNNINGEELWPLGWVQHRHKAKAGYVSRSGLHRMLAWPYLFQNYALGDLAELLDIYGVPAKIGKYPRNATDKEKATLLRAVTSLGHHAAGIIPEGMNIDFMEAADGKADLFLAMMNWCEKSKAKVILGGTLTSGTGEGTNTNALGNVHERSLQSLISSDVRQYSSTIIRDMLWPLALVNFGIEDVRRAPRFFMDTSEPEDLKHLSESLPNFVDLGMQIPQRWLHEKTHIPEPKDGEPVLQRQQLAPTVPLKSQPTCQHGHVATLTSGLPDNDTSILLADRMETETADPMRTWLKEIRAMAEGVGSLEELRDKLLRSYGDLDAAELRSIMELGFTVGQGVGAEEVIDETERNNAE